jgi:hypothetical protein
MAWDMFGETCNNNEGKRKEVYEDGGSWLLTSLLRAREDPVSPVNLVARLSLGWAS